MVIRFEISIYGIRIVHDLLRNERTTSDKKFICKFYISCDFIISNKWNRWHHLQLVGWINDVIIPFWEDAFIQVHKNSILWYQLWVKNTLHVAMCTCERQDVKSITMWSWITQLTQNIFDVAAPTPFRPQFNRFKP